MKDIYVYEIAHNQKEAMQLAADGYGYETREDAEKSLASPEIDNYYRSKLKVFKIKLITED